MAEYLRDKMSDGMPDSMSGHMPRWGSDEVKKQLRSLRSRFLLMQDEIHLEAGDALELPLHLSMPSFDKLMKENEDRGFGDSKWMRADTFGQFWTHLARGFALCM
jgi:hypothetical protein